MLQAFRIFRRTGPSESELFQTLEQERPISSRINQDRLVANDTFAFDKTDWVPLWYDRAHAVTSNCGAITAYRAVPLDGMLLWYVFRNRKTRGYHAANSDPNAAIAEAKDAWARRKQIKARWSDIEQIARDLRRGRQSFEVRRSDAHASPLCSLGIDGFMRSIGMGRVEQVSGRMAGMLMKIEPQLGFVIYEAWQRTQAEARARPPRERHGHHVQNL